MRIVIWGASGQLGTELQLLLAGHELILVGRAQADITDASAATSLLNDARPDVVINAAAYNLVDRAEDEPDVAFSVNALGPRNLALWCEPAGARLVHVSSDFVFPGTICEGSTHHNRQTPYSEEDAPAPRSAYGVSKLAGEHFVRAICRRHLVVRTCGLFGRAQGTKGNFVETMLRLGREGRELRVVNDQVCTPTSAADLARFIVSLIEKEAYGLFHATNSGQTSWFEFAREIFRHSGLDAVVRPVTSDEYGAKATRPSYSVLDTTKLQRLLGQAIPTWQDALERYLAARSEG